MKAVLINSWYKQYSTGKLVYAFRDYLIQQGHEILTFYGRGENINDFQVYKTVSAIEFIFMQHWQE